MQLINATDLDRKSGGGWWRDLRFFPRVLTHPLKPDVNIQRLTFLKQTALALSSRPKRSEVEGPAVRPAASANLPHPAADLPEANPSAARALHQLFDKGSSHVRGNAETLFDQRFSGQHWFRFIQGGHVGTLEEFANRNFITP
jgi:hypothetical protein